MRLKEQQTPRLELRERSEDYPHTHRTTSQVSISGRGTFQRCQAHLAGKEVHFGCQSD
mgnify:CR=1 FL=1